MIDLQLGIDEKTNTTILYPFDSKDTPNGHSVILGRSGSGKTTAALLLQYQSICNGIPVLNFDFSGSYDHDKFGLPFSNLLNEKINIINVHDEGIGVNPFELYQIDATNGLNNIVDTAERISEIMTSVLKLGKSQKNSIYHAIKKGLLGDWYPINNDNPFIYELHKDAERNPIMDMNALRYLLAEQRNTTSGRAIDNISPLLDKQIFIKDTKHSWSNILFGKPMLTIIDLNHYSSSTQQILLELILHDLWGFIKINGDTKRPFITVFDEAQNLNHKAGSPIAKILNEGRKFGWSSWFIMQSTSQLNQDELSRIGQASLQLFFNPPQPDIHKISRLISPDAPKKYIKQLEQLEKGACLAKGTFKNEYGVTFHNTVKKVTIPDASTLFKSQALDKLSKP